MPPHVHPGSRAGRRTSSPYRLPLFSILVVLITTFAALALGVSPSTAQTGEIFVTITDDQGPDQLDQANDPGNSQQDITGARIGSEGSFGWAWDETDLSGNNSIDTCTYFEEADGTVISVCYSVQFNEDGTIADGFPTYEVYDCDTTYDAAQQKCTGNNPVAADYDVTCGNPVVVDSYFTPDDQPDLQADCTVTLTDGSPASDLLLLNTCTKTSASPSSNSNDCLFSAPPAFIQLQKVVEGGDASPADFTLSATVESSIVSGPGPLVPLTPIPTGTIDLSETAEQAILDTYELESLVCTYGDGAVVDVTDSQSIEVEGFDRVICVFTNAQKVGDLIIEKVVVNDNGGDAVADDFDISTSATVDALVFSEVSTDGDTTTYRAAVDAVVAGNYTVSEADVDGYDEGDWSCATTEGVAAGEGNFDSATVTVVAGETVVCTITNDDDDTSLTLVKNVVNDNGGSADADDFTLSADDIDVTGSETGVVATDQAGTYELSESTLDGYSLMSLTCDNSTDPGPVSEVTVGLGENVTCTFVNDDNEPGLTLVKVVNNDNGGTSVAAEWTLTAEGYDADEPEAGTYDLSESGPDGYQLTSLTCTNSGDAQVTSVTLGLGENVTCTFVNDDVAPSLTLVKEVENNNGGTAVPGDWELFAAGYDPANPMVNQAFALTESDGPAGYTLDSIVCKQGGTFDDTVDPPTITLGLGEDVICTFTNDDVAPGLELEKKVINDNGGDAEANEWTLQATDADGEAFDGSPGTYKLTESGGREGYELTGVECEGGDLEKIGDDYFITIALGESVECTFTNDDIAPSLTLIKLVENDEGRTAVPSDFTLYAGDNEVIGSPIGEVVTDQAGTYALDEDGPDGYTLESLTCDNSGDIQVDQVTVALGEDVTCTFVNGDDIIPDPAIDLDKDAEPATARIFDEITYTFTAKNIGNVPLSNVTITDPLPGLSPITCNATTEMGKEFTGNGTGTLEVGDTIVCTATVTVTPELVTDGTVDNVAEATGEYPGDPATVVDDDGAASVIIITDVEGCTFTQGYWRTHAGKAQPNGKSRGNGKGPRVDATWHAVGGPHAELLHSGVTYYDALWSPVEGDAWYILAQQYIAAELNSLKADTTTSIDAVVGEPLLAEAAALLNDGVITDAERARALELAEVFDQYNNGEIIYYDGGVFIGPPHCE